MEPHELMNAIIGAKPVDFDKGFSDMVQGRVAELVADRKLEVAKSFFGDPDATVEVGDDEEDNLTQDSGDENDNTPDPEETPEEE